MLRIVLLLTGLLSSAVLAVEPEFPKQVAALERENGGRIGVAALNPSAGQRLAYRADEPFALCSTFKLLLAAAVLSRVDAGEESLSRVIKYREADLLSYAPITRKNLGAGGMTVGDLTAAAIEYSDNTAANLLLETLGGPAGLTRYLRAWNDKITRLDRNETALNTNLPQDPRDTTQPAAMLATMNQLLLGPALSTASKQQLADWLIHNTTGTTKLRAGLNPSWKVGDKTGSGDRGATNDVAIVWPTNRAPFLLAVYYSGAPAEAAKKDAVFAEIARLVSAAFTAQ